MHPQVLQDYNNCNQMYRYSAAISIIVELERELDDEKIKRQKIEDERRKGEAQ